MSLDLDDLERRRAEPPLPGWLDHADADRVLAELRRLRAEVKALIAGENVVVEMEFPAMRQGIFTPPAPAPSATLGEMAREHIRTHNQGIPYVPDAPSATGEEPDLSQAWRVGPLKPYTEPVTASEVAAAEREEFAAGFAELPDGVNLMPQGWMGGAQDPAASGGTADIDADGRRIDAGGKHFMYQHAVEREMEAGAALQEALERDTAKTLGCLLIDEASGSSEWLPEDPRGNAMLEWDAGGVLTFHRRPWFIDGPRASKYGPFPEASR